MTRRDPAQWRDQAAAEFGMRLDEVVVIAEQSGKGVDECDWKRDAILNGALDVVRANIADGTIDPQPQLAVALELMARDRPWMLSGILAAALQRLAVGAALADPGDVAGTIGDAAARIAAHAMQVVRRHGGLRCATCNEPYVYDQAAADQDRCSNHQPKGEQ